MKTWDELNGLHDQIVKIMKRENDVEKMRTQSVELEMIAFFRAHHADNQVKVMKEQLEEGLTLMQPPNNRNTMVRINMCNWFLKNQEKEQEKENKKNN